MSENGQSKIIEPFLELIKEKQEKYEAQTEGICSNLILAVLSGCSLKLNLRFSTWY